MALNHRHHLLSVALVFIAIFMLGVPMIMTRGSQSSSGDSYSQAAANTGHALLTKVVSITPSKNGLAHISTDHSSTPSPTSAAPLSAGEQLASQLLPASAGTTLGQQLNTP